MSRSHKERSWNRISIHLKGIMSRWRDNSIYSIIARRLTIFTVSLFIGVYILVRLLDIVTFKLVTASAPQSYLFYRDKILRGEAVGKSAIEFVKKTGEEYDNILMNWQYFEMIFICVLSILIVLWLSRSTAKLLSDPIVEISQGAEKLAQGSAGARIDTNRELPAEISSLMTSFNAMATELDHLEQERKLTAAAVAHELATPLMILRGRLQGMFDDLYEPNKLNISLLIAQVDALGRLVEDLRTLSLYTAGQIPLNIESVNVKTASFEVIQYFSDQPHHMKIEFVGEAVDLSVDAFRFRQMLFALVENALKYAAGGARIEIAAERIHLNDHTLGVKVTVSDDGPGFPTNDVERVFDPFRRGGNTVDGQLRGTGLGLSVVRAIVEAHGGHVAASNDPRGGAQVKAVFPGPPVLAV